MNALIGAVSLLITLTTTAGATIFDIVRSGNVDVVERHLNQFPSAADSLDEQGRTPLHITDDPVLIAILIEAGVSPHRGDPRGRTPFGLAVEHALRFPWLRERKIEALSAYVSAGVEFPVDGVDGRFLLHAACRLGHFLLAESLLRSGADLASTSSSGGTVLHSIAEGGDIALFDMAVAERLSDIDRPDRYDLTPLMVAAMEGHLPLVQRLAENGADVTIHDSAGRNAANHARDFTHGVIVDFLAKHGVAPVTSPMTGLTGDYLGQPAPDERPQPFATGVVSTIHYDHSSPTFAPDGKTIYWSSAYTSRGDFILSSTLESGEWSAPRIEPFCRPGGTYMYPTPAPEGNRLYFTSDHPLPGAEPGQEMNIWYVDREGDGWSEPRLVGFPGGNEYGLSIAGNGTLYFMSEVSGNADLFLVRPKDGAFGAPEPLGDAVNSPYYEDEPFISLDERYLLFASLRPTENGGRLLVSTREDDGWTSPVSFSDRIELEGNLRFPSVSPDGRYFFFASDAKGNWDLYWTDVHVLDGLAPIEG